MSEKVCGNCKHFLPQQASLGQAGDCRHSPPSVVVLFGISKLSGKPATEIKSAWPAVGRDEVACGQFRLKSTMENGQNKDSEQEYEIGK